jgi:hypothetical protein
VSLTEFNISSKIIQTASGKLGFELSFLSHQQMSKPLEKKYQDQTKVTEE